MRDLTIFIITCGEESSKKCMDSIRRQEFAGRHRPHVEIIKDVYPMSEAFNQMHARAKTPYFVQVDADVVLNKDAVGALYEEIKRSNFFIYAAYGQLYEEGFGPGGRVRCWKKGIFRMLRFRDVRTVDRDFWKRAACFGFYIKDVGKVLGIHKPRHSNFSDYLKTKSDLEKWQYLRRPFIKYADSLYKGLIEDPHKHRYKILGFSMGVLASKKRICKSKDINVENERLKSIFNLLNIDFGNFTLRKNIDFARLFNILKRSYCNYSSVEKRKYVKDAFRELINSDFDEESLDRHYHIVGF